MSNTTVTGGETLNPAPATPIATQAPRAKGARIPQEVLDAAIAEYRAGASMTDVALKYDVSRNHLYERAVRAGVRKLVRVPHGVLPEEAVGPAAVRETDTVFRPRVRLSDATWVQIRRDYEKGWTAPSIEARYGCAEATVRDRAQREGWRRRDRKPAPLAPAPDPAQVETLADGAVVSAWDRVAHPAQKPPSALPDGRQWSTWLFMGGRGAGKTRAGAEWLAAQAAATENGRFALIGATLHDVREVMICGPSGLLALPGRAAPTYEASRRRLVWKNGAVAHAFSADEPERLRGPQFHAAWADEFCTWRRGDYTLMLARMGLRLGALPRLVVTTTPRPLPAMRALIGEATCAVTRAATAENAANLAPGFVADLRALYGRTRFARQELEGLMLDGEGALWRAETFVAARGPAPAELERVIVAVDPPAGTAGAACGIVAAARSGDRAVVLADATCAGLSPLGWAGAAVAAARAWGADEIVAEANHGGDMVRTVLAMADPPCPVRLVHAALSKTARAQPAAALYEQGRVIHAGDFPALEEELMALGGGDDEGRRLDRADALVWALTELMVKPAPVPRIGWL